MQERKKRRIVIASVLKPVDDTRMFEKIGKSLGETARFDIHIFGYPSGKIPQTSDSDITQHASQPFGRLNIKRLTQPLKILKKILRLKPELLIITTHELLFIAFFIKLLTKCCLLYDVQENYYRNILYTNAYPSMVRPLLAVYVRIKEIIFSSWIDYFIVAETGYTYEITFLKNKSIIIENKMKRPSGILPKKNTADQNIHLLFSGTLAETTGIFSAIALAKSLYIAEPRIRLTIIGYSPQARIFNQIKKEIAGADFIHLIGGDTLVQHSEILKAIQQSDFGIIAYPPNKSTENCIPTKLYEYLGCKLPILMVNHPLWVKRCHLYPACIPIDFNTLDVSSILLQMSSTKFYITAPEDVFWEEEAEKLVNLVDHILLIRNDKKNVF
ncbi:glycosyltransferase family protein [Ohtaekwangia koreensis]|uniref:Glycosyltransferase involved in cell wall bisynthesis n=1 Tax=Ohtaekwangia koreensis TaxID=688867 RepID=A0A1T5M532_9BACT|nr:hypothetical protein [Ohtaekwangia koreensis]SKC83154.1 Glycosyltransferase involved in cell wall bisynthesis [Ohtaekwangia koreensis]